MEPKWENFADEVQRIAIPGGHLYRTASWVEMPTDPETARDGYWHWSGPVFVPDPPAKKGSRR